MEFDTSLYLRTTIQILLLGLTILGVALNILFLVLLVVFSLKYRQAMGYPGLLEKAVNLDREREVSGVTVAYEIGQKK
jgi:hypothetical protein